MTDEIINNKMLELAIKEQSGIAVYFYSDQCAPCVSLRPKVARLIAGHYPKMKLVFVNSQRYPEIPAKYGVFANPCILMFFEGKEFRRYSKYISIRQIDEDIKRIYTLAFDE